MPSHTRSDLRKERYRHMRSLGFSAIEARKYRDNKQSNIIKFVSSEHTRITKIPAKKRVENERKILSNIRRTRRQPVTVDNAPRLKPQRERLEDFSRWTGDRNFPDWAISYIAEQNQRAGLSPLNSYGFRRFYYRYVQNRPEATAAILADRDDS